MFTNPDIPNLKQILSNCEIKFINNRQLFLRTAIKKRSEQSLVVVPYPTCHYILAHQEER